MIPFLIVGSGRVQVNCIVRELIAETISSRGIPVGAAFDHS